MKVTSMSRRTLLKAAASVSVASPWIAARADDLTLRIGAGHPTPALAYVMVADTFFVPEVVKRAQAKGINVRFIKAWAGTVAKVDGIVEAVQKGTLDIGLSVPAFEQSRTALLNYSLYFPFTSPDHMMQQKVGARMLREVPALQASMKPFNVYVLAMSVSETYGMMLRRDLTSLSDLKGMKIACAGANAPWVQAVGAAPIQLPIGENYQGLQTGLIDGNIYFVSGLSAFKLNEVAKFYLKSDYGSFVSNTMFMNLDVRSKLPMALVDIIDQVAGESSLKVAELSKKRDEEAEAANKDKVKFVTLANADKRRWAEALKDLPSKAAKELDAKGLAGTATFQSHQKFLAEAGHKFPIAYSV